MSTQNLIPDNYEVTVNLKFEPASLIMLAAITIFAVILIRKK